MTFGARTVLRSLVVVVAAAALAPSVAAAALPSILTQDAKRPFRVRPPSISYTGDGTGFIGGPDGTDVNHLGRIQWPVYTGRQAVGRGLGWLNDCGASCAEGTFSSTPVTVHTFAPRGGRFRRLTLKYTFEGKPVTDRRRVGRLPSFDNQ